MPSTLSPDFARAVFRANPRYDLVAFDQLPGAQQELFGYLRADPAHYGLLQPRQGAALGIKAVDRDTAHLYQLLRSGGHLPATLHAEHGEQADRDVARLVLDGILEIEAEGQFLSGSTAYPRLYPDSPVARAEGRVAQLSLEAVRYAQRLGTTSILKLAARLYFYNRLPVTPDWRRRWPTAAATVESLGLQQDGGVPGPLHEHWRRAAPAQANGWLMWRARRGRARRAPNQPVFKLYVSPRPEAAREVLHTTLDVLSPLGADPVKIGQDVYGLLRPDKLVAYFGSFEQLSLAAAQLARSLDGCPAHGVPFTAALTADGLLSWGLDPPAGERLLPWQTGESWRVWVAHRLAIALLAAREAGATAIEPWHFALERLALEGIDTGTWTPSAALWQPPTMEVD